MKLLLLSNSTNPGEQYLEWATGYISDFNKKYAVKKVLFIPYAGVTVNWDDYEAKVKTVYKTLGLDLISIHHFDDPIKAVEQAKSIAVGGGNTFQLLKLIQKNGLLEPIKRRVLEGMPFSGWSAGSNIAGPTICTTNDMPIVQPKSFKSLNLIPFQINPHYLDANPEGHGGETRQQRIEEYLEVNRKAMVLGLREASLLEVTDHIYELKGRRNMFIFTYKKEPIELEVGDSITEI